MWLYMEERKKGKKRIRDAIEKAIKKADVAVPKGPHENDIQGWWFDDEQILEAQKEGKMLTLDLDVGQACDMACYFCFAETHTLDLEDYVAKTTKRVNGIIDEAVELGLKSIKIVGAGEPLLFKRLLEIIKHAWEKGVQTVLFTSGHVIGDDRLAAKIFGKEGIKDGKELAQKLANLEASVIVKFLTFDYALHAKMTPHQRKDYDYLGFRDKGIVNLIEAGLNSHTKTRLGVDCLLMKENFQEAVELFDFFNSYNMFCVLNTSMDCGKTALDRELSTILTKDEALEAAVELYTHCLEKGIPFDKRISPYFCSRVCSQLNHGIFIGDNGVVKACPGGPKIGKYEKGELRRIFRDNPFRGKRIGHKCISRAGKTYHKDFEQRVRKKLCI